MFRFKENAHWLNSLLSPFLNRSFCCLTDSISTLLWDYFPSQPSFNFTLLWLLKLLYFSLFKVALWDVGFFPHFYTCVMRMNMLLTGVSTEVATYWEPSISRAGFLWGSRQEAFLCLLAMVATCIHWLDSVSTFSFHVVDFIYIFLF